MRKDDAGSMFIGASPFLLFFSQLTRSDQVLSLVSIVMGGGCLKLFFLFVVFLLCVEDVFVPIIN